MAGQTPTTRKASDEELRKLDLKNALWSRKDSTINELVWKDFDLIFDEAMIQARKEKAYEAFTYLSHLRDTVTIKRPHQIAAEYIIASGKY